MYMVIASNFILFLGEKTAPKTKALFLFLFLFFLTAYAIVKSNQLFLRYHELIYTFIGRG